MTETKLGIEARDLGAEVYIAWLETPDATGYDLLWLHPCTDGRSEAWGRCDVTTGERHRITAGGRGDEEHLTIEGSLLCVICQFHGFIRDGNWVPA